jgi:hypothetical protein
MEFALEAAFKEVEEDQVKVKAGSTITIKLTVDACIDGTDPATTLSGVVSYKLIAETGGVALTISSDVKSAETETLLPKK